MNTKKLSKWLRLFLLIGLLVLVTYQANQHQVLGGGKAPSVHALCPYGALESLYTLMTAGSFIQKIYSGTVVLFVLTLVLAIVFRRSFCGLLCPFGALQEVFAKLGQKIFKKRFLMPDKLDKPLRYLKYVILALTIIMAWYYGSLWMAPYDPYSAFAHITAIKTDLSENPIAIIGYIILLITIVGSLIYDRFFCKYLCPVGAFYGIIGKFSITKIERNNDLCIHCQKCDKACPVNIQIEKTDKVTSMECINCNECVLACPKKGALENKTAKKTIQPIAALGLVVGLFFGTILIAQWTGNFNVLPEKLKAGETISISEIKGYFTIEETAEAVGTDLKDVYKKLNIPENIPATTKMKEISQLVPGYDFDKQKEAAEEGNTSEKAILNSGKTEVPNKIDVSGIRGSMTIREAADSLKMDLKDFYKLFKIPEQVPAQTIMKDIGTISTGYDFHKIKSGLE